MPFQIKDFVSITAGLLNHARATTDKITDFQPGSVARTIMEAPAIEVEELYLQMLLGLRDAIPVATFKSFGFDRLPAARAHGFVSLSKSPAPDQAITIPQGTVFGTSDGRSYVSTEPLIWTAGVPVVRVQVQSTVVGAAGNIAAGGITYTALPGESYVVNNSAITSGRDVETDPERELRFADFVRSLSRGTLEACRYAVQWTSLPDADGNVDEYVTRVGTLEQRGYVRFWLYSSKGVASPELIAKAQQALDGYKAADGSIVPGFRPAGVPVDALAMAERAIPLSVRVGMYDGFTLTIAVRQKIADLFASTIRAVPAGSTLYLKELVESMLAVDGVRIIVPDSTENIQCAVSEALVPGALNITAL